MAADTLLVKDLIETGCLVINDGYRAKNSELSDLGIPFARAQNIKNGFTFDDADCFPVNNLARVGQKISQPGDVVFTSKGTVGRFAYVRKDTPVFVYSPQLCFWRSLDQGKIDPRWLYYWMQSRDFYVQYSSVAGQTDMAEYVSLRDQRDMQISIPSHSDQRGIAWVLGNLDDKIDLNQRMNQTLESLARAIFKSWFVNFDPVRAKMEGSQPAGMDAETSALFPDAFEDSPLGKIPKEWKLGFLGDIAGNPRTPVRASDLTAGVPYIALDCMPRRSIALSEWGDAGSVQSNKSAFAKGDLLFGKLRPYFHKVGVAPVDGVCSTDILVIRPTEVEFNGMVLMTISSDDFVAYTDMSSTGTKMPRTNWSDMSGYQMTIPPPVVAAAFNSLVYPFVAKIQENILRSIKLAGIRDTLLPKLISGELRMKDAEKIVEELDEQP
jgi:type I restriction enzyme S subunit